jgi:hypothetical protein
MILRKLEFTILSIYQATFCSLAKSYLIHDYLTQLSKRCLYLVNTPQIFKHRFDKSHMKKSRIIIISKAEIGEFAKQQLVPS